MQNEGMAINGDVYFIVLVTITLCLFVDRKIMAQDVSIRENYFPMPVGLKAEFEHTVMDDAGSPFVFAIDDEFVIFNRGNATLSVPKPNVIELT